MAATRLKTDLVLAPFDTGIADMVEAARIADAGGIDTVWTYDHFSGLVTGRRWARDPWVVLTAIAAATERINVGVLVANVANRHPAQLACAVNSLQSLAPGRVLLGLGAGASAGRTWASESDAIGRAVAPLVERRAHLVESIAALRAIWSNEAFRGDRLTVAADAAITDGSAAPPIIVGASGERTLDVACEHADGANLLPGDDLADRIAMVRARRPARFDVGVFDRLDTDHPLGGDPEPLAELGVDRRTLWVAAPYPLDAIARVSEAVPVTVRGLLGAMVVAIPLVAGCSMFRLERAPDDVERMFQDMGGPGMGCTPIARDAERMARAEVPGGGAIELWVAPTVEGGHMEVMIEKSGDGLGGGGSGGCGGDPAGGDEIMWSGGMASFNEQTNTGWSLLSGRAPAGAETVAIVFGDDDPIVTEVQVDGYFMIAKTITSMNDMDIVATPDRVDALDADGEVIATRDL